MKPYIVFAVCAVLAGFGPLVNLNVEGFLMTVFGLGAVVLPLVMVLNKPK